MEIMRRRLWLERQTSLFQSGLLIAKDNMAIQWENGFFVSIDCQVEVIACFITSVLVLSQE